MIGVIQLSASISATARYSVSVTLGCLSHICMTDIWWVFFLVTDSRDRESARLFSCLGMCSTGAFWNRAMLLRAVC